MSTNINGSGEASEENYSTEESGSAKRRIVVPGETIIEGEDYLPGEGTRREGLKIVSSKFGLAEEAGRLIKIISIFGAFVPRKGNVVVGRVTDLNYAGWVVDIDCAAAGFLPIEESPRFINRNEMDQYLKIGDVIAIRPQSLEKVLFKNASLAMKKYEAPSWIALNKEEMKGTVRGLPTAQEANPGLDIPLILEFYSR